MSYESVTLFESFANSERYKTKSCTQNDKVSLRALLIQKDTKQAKETAIRYARLRALLIQKDTKLQRAWCGRICGLRALLIQKDTKLDFSASSMRTV